MAGVTLSKLPLAMHLSTSASERPITAAIAPAPFGTSISINIPLCLTTLQASSKLIAPPAVTAPYSPSESPILTSDVIFVLTASSMAISVVYNAICVYSVLSNKSFSSNISFSISSPVTSDAFL